jgi:rhodanese-related sulfurtransferase
MKNWILYALFVVVIILAAYSAHSPYELSSTDAKKMIRNNQFDAILDVRTKEERQTGFYKGSVHIPEDTLKQGVQDQYPDRNTKILIYCATGRRAKHATDTLRSMGYSNVFFIRGTYTDLL